MKIVIHLCLEPSPVIQNLITTLGYDCIHGAGTTIAQSYTHILRFDKQGLSLAGNTFSSGQASASPTKVDFLDGSLRYRRQTSGKSQGIAKAVGLNKMEAPTVLDATAGLGKDSFILASLGCSVTLLERSPLVHALLADGFRRGLLGDDLEVSATLETMALINTDALTYFSRISAGELDKPDVIFLDPMFPPRSKTAKVKKDISLLQDVLGIDDDFEELLAAARGCARHRVVVKRPGKRSKKLSPKPDFQIDGKSTHFDIFI